MSGTKLQATDWVAETVEGLPALSTVAEIVAILRTSRRNVYRLAESGRLRAIRAKDSGSSRLLFPRSAIADYLRGLDSEAAA